MDMNGTWLDYADPDNSSNCTNDYCISDEDYMDMVLSHISPDPVEWVLIAMHAVVFVVGLVGNALVCLAVYRNPGMRTVTNYFIVNLAAADFLVILCCLPPTVLWDVTETWFFGNALCKIILYFQTVSVAVSVLTLTFISVDRWYAICFPLRFKSTTARAKTAIIIIWVIALSIDIPEMVTLTTVPRDWHFETVIFTQCEAAWSQETDTYFTTAKIVLLYTLPLLFMTIAYCQIVRVLWTSRNIPGHSETVKIPNNNLLNSRRRTLANATTEAQLRSRRKAAKMLVAVVIMFAICYFPVHLYNILRYTVDIAQDQTTVIFVMLSHWLCYANSAVNPLIYNFMSDKYRKEFKKAFNCWWKEKPRSRRCIGESTTFRLSSARTETIALSAMATHIDTSPLFEEE